MLSYERHRPLRVGDNAQERVAASMQENREKARKFDAKGHMPC